jgi:Tol biopolymer transport system component
MIIAPFIRHPEIKAIVIFMAKIPKRVLMKKWILYICAVLVANCSMAQQNVTLSVSGNYLGQTPPGNEAVLFAKGIISTDSIEHSAPAFSPKNDRVLWSPVKRGAYPNTFLLEMTRKKNKWSQAVTPSFADGQNDDIYPVFGVDGKKLYFSSRRGYAAWQLPARRSNEGLRIWAVDRKRSGWGDPYPLDSAISNGFEYAHSVSASGTLFFSSTRPGGRGSLDLYYSTYADGNYQRPVAFDTTINTPGYEDGPYIAPDESFFIFESNRPGGVEGSIDLYICFKKAGGGWTLPRNMGNSINTKSTERFARLSPDGKYLFFGRVVNGQFDVYWISAEIIGALRSG